MKEEEQEGAKRIFSSKDMEIMVTLDAKGFEVVDVYKDNGFLYYDFYRDQIADDLHKIIFGEEVMVSATKLWDAFKRFKSNLRMYF